MCFQKTITSCLEVCIHVFTVGLCFFPVYFRCWQAKRTTEHGLQDKCVVSTCVEFNLYCTMLKHFHTSLTVICMLKHLPHLLNNTILRSYFFVKDFPFVQTAPYLNYFKIRPPPPKTINLATRDEEKNKRVGTITYCNQSEVCTT